MAPVSRESVFTDEERAKLPKWAQQKVAQIEYQMRDLEALVDTMNGVGDGWVELQSMIGPKIRTEKFVSVSCHTKGGKVSLIQRDGFLELNSHPDGLIIQPRAANVSYISVGYLD